MTLIIDNYDSFTYNIVQQVGKFTKKIEVVKNDQISIEQINRLRCSHIVISPGPGDPANAGESNNVIIWELTV